MVLDVAIGAASGIRSLWSIDGQVVAGAREEHHAVNSKMLLTGIAMLCAVVCPLASAAPPGYTVSTAAATSYAAPVLAPGGDLLKLPSVLPDRVLNVPILMYHHVSSAPAATALNYSLTVTDESFRSQLGYLQTHGFHTVLLPQVFAALYRGARLPARPVVLTFDDGYLDNYTDALPVLRAYHALGEFNIISGYVGLTLGVNSYMNWAQLKALVAAGMEIGSHTVDHQDLGILPVLKIRFELRDSRNVLQQKLSVPVQFLAYPSGQPFARGDTGEEQTMLSLMPQYGYVGALLDGPHATSRQDARLPFELQRIRVAGGEGLAAFAATLQG